MATKPKQCIVAAVDDDARIRESLKDLLASAGFEARLFSSGDEMLKGDDLDLSSCLITDVRMPDMDGWELHQRAVTRLPNLPVIFITAYQDDVAWQRALKLGAFDILYKPFDGEELLESVEAAIRQVNQSDSSCH